MDGGIVVEKSKKQNAKYIKWNFSRFSVIWSFPLEWLSFNAGATAAGDDDQAGRHAGTARIRTSTRRKALPPILPRSFPVAWLLLCFLLNVTICTPRTPLTFLSPYEHWLVRWFVRSLVSWSDVDKNGDRHIQRVCNEWRWTGEKSPIRKKKHELRCFPLKTVAAVVPQPRLVTKNAFNCSCHHRRPWFS